MNSFELTAENILKDYGCYYHKTHTKTVLTRRAKKFKAFIESLGRTPTWVYQNVSIITCPNFYNPPEPFRGRASKHIGGADHNHLWAVLPPLQGWEEWLTELIDDTCESSMIEKSGQAWDVVENVTNALSERLKLIKGE